MRKILFFILFFLTLSFSVDNLRVQQQDVLYVQNIIEKEEMIARNFEKYLLNEFAIPAMNDLQTDEYLGKNFTIKNRMGDSFVLDASPSLIKLNYGIKDQYLKKIDDDYNYIVQLYNRDLYRNNTYVIFDKDDDKKSYIEIQLKSPEAKNIYKILKEENEKIAKNCSSESKGYCNNQDDERTIRWYDNSSNWIEYSKKDFKDGNINVNSNISDEKRKELKIGSHIFKNKESQSIRFME